MNDGKAYRFERERAALIALKERSGKKRWGAFAKACGFSPGTMANIRNRKKGSLEEFHKAADAFGLSWDQFISLPETECGELPGRTASGGRMPESTDIERILEEGDVKDALIRIYNSLNSVRDELVLMRLRIDALEQGSPFAGGRRSEG